MRHGASDYLTKPVKTEELVRVVERAVREASLRREVSRLRKEVHKEYSFHLMGTTNRCRPSSI